MSQSETQPALRRGIATRTVILLIIIAGLSAGAAAFAFANAQAATNNPTNSFNTNHGQWPGWRGPGPLGWHQNGTFTSFRAASTIANVSITGFNIVDSSHLTVTLSYTGTGTTPASTIVVVAPGLSGSNTLSSGWSSGTNVSVHLVGSGSLSSSMTCIRVLVVPLTGA